jgi:pimeloyl-ACP methyl ester carboxylesterase
MSTPTHTRFRWLERGAGEPVLLLHGLLGEMDHWESTLEALGPFRRPIALELPIFDPDLTDVSVPALASYVRRFMEAIELPPAIVCGNSLGGHVALELALSCPGWVDGLILTGSSGLFERTFTSHVPHVPTRAYVRERMEEIFRRAGHAQWGIDPPHRDHARTALQCFRWRAARPQCRAAEPGPRPDPVVWGKDDRITPSDVAERFHARIRGSQLVYLPTVATRRCSSGRRRSRGSRRLARRDPCPRRPLGERSDRAGRRRGAPYLPGASPPRARVWRATPTACRRRPCSIGDSAAGPRSDARIASSKSAPSPTIRRGRRSATICAFSRSGRGPSAANAISPGRGGLATG